MNVTLPDSLPDFIRAGFDAGSGETGVIAAPSVPDLTGYETGTGLKDADLIITNAIQEGQDNHGSTGLTEEQATEVAEAAALPSQPLTEPIPGRNGVSKVIVASVDATDWIVGKKDPNAYTPQRMVDGIETTAFQFSTKTTKLGKEYLYFDFPGAVTVDELWIKNGFWKITEGLDQYTRNSRVKKMTVEYRYEGNDEYRDSKAISLKDDKKRQDWTVIDLGRHENVTGIRILIQDIYKGSKFKTDVCISEIMFVQKD